MSVKRVRYWGVSVLMGLLFFSWSQASPLATDPVEMLQSVTQEVLQELKVRHETLQKNPKQVSELMSRLMLPHVDLEGMARWVLGRNAWMDASTEQQAQFTEEFRHLMINTYAGALSEYRNQTIEYFPIRGGAAGKERVQVASVIHDPGREVTHIVYRLVSKQGEWKVYDIVIEGVSLLKGFQAQFATDLEKKGLAQLIQDLKSHNQS